MPRPGLRSAAAATKGRRPETEAPARDDREAAAGGNKMPGRPKRQPTGSRQLRSGASGPPEEGADAARPSRKRRMTVELRAPHPSPKRRRGFRVLPRRGAGPQPTRGDDEGEEAAPDSQAFYDSINKHSGAAGGTTVRPDERHSDSLQAEEQLQGEYRDRAGGAGEGDRPQGPETADESSPRTSKQSRGARGENAGPAARNAPSRSVDLGSDSPSPHQAPGGADEDEERPSESDGEGQGSDEQRAETARIALHLPHGSEAPLVVDVAYGGLDSMIRLINRPGWAHGSAQELPPQPDEDEGEWWTRVNEHLKHKQCEPLYKDMFRLLRLYQETPRAPDFGAQIDHLGRHKDDVETMLNSIDGVVGEILADILKVVDVGGDGKPSRRARRAKRAKSIYEGIMPMLILCLKEAFLVGGDSATTPGGSFTACTLQPLCLIAAWFVRLYDAMHAALATGPEQPGGESQHGKPGAADKNREDLRKWVEGFHYELERATAELEELADAPRRLQEATEQDRAIKAFRAMRQRKRREARERQMQRFVDWKREAAYFARHGWHLWEDERLLDMVRETVTPPTHELAASVPGRSEAEVGRRVRQLKESVRRKFEATGKVPPRWCFDG